MLIFAIADRILDLIGLGTVVWFTAKWSIGFYSFIKRF